MAASTWSLRDVSAVTLIIVCFCFAWLVSMGQNLFLLHFPDREYANQQLENARGPLDDTFLGEVQRSYWGPHLSRGMSAALAVVCSPRLLVDRLVELRLDPTRQVDPR
ncbi:hypothetical protein AK812_SmicGene8296 [Symbiodinium microadriaticum]|uniref:Uncharacterized protein n=1 Tax=Symbiodinium microadriaticum TaxID=2951 RepID=A0A1Q9ELI4_SYMMI|nr:hypothetical protein AK812_SmicGene8296 [Symbiodinium microadriaticum]